MQNMVLDVERYISDLQALQSQLKEILLGTMQYKSFYKRDLLFKG